MTDKFSCTSISSSVNEQLFGTAPRVDHWFLIEYNGNWAYDAFSESNIPQMVKEYINNELQNIENSRIQVIKAENNQDSGPRFYYAHSSEFEPGLYEFQLEQYVDILDIDLVKLSENNGFEEHRSNKQLALVCSHGSHDRCCGTYGIPVYNKLREQKNFETWRTSHVGGHRFSANIIMLPEGIYYGRVNGDNLDKITDSHKKKEIYLDCYRGRSCYTQTTQVSDYFLRNKTGEKGIYDIKVEYEKDREYNVSVEFCLNDKDIGYSVNSVVLYDSVHIPTSCDETEYKSIPQFYFYSLFPYTPSKRKKD